MHRFEYISSDCARRAWALAYSLVRNAADADDAVQKAYLVAWQRREVIPEDPWPWFAVVVANSVRNLNRAEARRTKREEHLQHQPTSAAVAPGSLLEQEELRDLVLAALAELPQEEREAVALCHIGGLTQAQASEASGVNLNTFKSRVKRGLDHMRGRLHQRTRDVEAYLATIAVPVPAGGWDAAALRWKSGAKAQAAQSGSGLLVALKVAAGLAIPCVAIGLAAWMLGLSARVPAQARPVAASVSEATLGEAGMPTRATTSVADDVGLTPYRVKLPVAVPEGAVPVAGADLALPPQVDQPAARQVLSPIPEAGSSTLRVRTSYYESGALYMQWIEEVTSGGAMLQGSFVRFHENGVLGEEGLFLNNKRHGTWTFRHDNGAIASQGEFADGLSEGVWTWWYANSVPMAKGAYRREKRQGEWQYWHTNGQIQAITHFKDNLADGVSTRFDEQGRKVRTITWRAGKKHGPETEFDQDGNATVNSTYIEGVRE